ncbi:MAG: translocation/assembly module TamB domain-containing protein [Candidatus Latescibacteria bacterium]|nr:translocation/assembly module TamB domain-containing protein [Candidatus Latescibacterota bacterium]
MTARRAAWLGLALGLALLVLVTPAGPWLLGLGLVRLAPLWGWQLSIGQTGGALARSISFADLRASSPGDSLQLEVAECSFALWKHSLTLRRPVLRLQLGEPLDSAATDTAATRLPIAYFPELELTGGVFHLSQPTDSLEVQVEGLAARYQATGDTTGELQLSTAHFLVAQHRRELVAGALQAALQLEPARLGLRQMQADLQRAGLQVRAEGSGSLGLSAALPALLHLGAQVQADSLSARLDLALEGRLNPLGTRLALQAQMDQSPLGPLSLRAQGALDSAHAAVDSLQLEAAGGLAQGALAYDLATDSLALQLRLDHLDLSRFGQFKGQVDAELKARANLREARYAGELDLWVRQLDALPGPPLDAQFQARLQPDHLLSATLDSRLGRVQAAGPVDPGGQYDLEFSGALNPSTLLGYAAAPFQLQGRARPDSLQLRLDSPSLPLGEIHLGPVRADLTLAAGRYLETALRLADTQVRAQLRADLQEDRRYTLVAELASLPLAQLDSSLAGALQGQLRASGGLDLATLRLDGQLQLQGAAYQGWQAGDLGLELECRSRRAQLLLSGQGIRATCTLEKGDRLDGQLELDQARFRRAGEDSLALSGSLHFAGRLSHPEKIAASGLLSRLALRQGGWEIRAADTLKFAYADQRLRCERFSLQTPAGLLRLEGSAGQEHLQVQGHIDALDLGNWSPAVTGTGQLHFALGGTPGRPQLQAQARLDQLQLKGHPLGQVQARLELADTLTFSADLEQDDDQEREFSLELAAPAAPLFAADYPTGAQLSLHLHARQADLRAPLNLLLADSIGGQLSLDGELRLPLSLLEDPHRWSHLEGQVLLGQLQLDKPGLRLHLADQAPAAIELDGDHLEVEGLELLLERFDPAESQLLKAGALSLKGVFSPSVPSLLQLELAGLDLRALDTWNQEEAGIPAGQADLQARFAGTLAAPDLEARLEISTEELGRIEGLFRGGSQEGDLKLEWLALSGDSLQLNARLPWDLEGGLVHWEGGWLQARSSGFSLLPLLDQLPELERLDGTLSMDLAVDGFADDMQISGWAEVQDLELRLLDMKPSYIFPMGRLEFAGRRGELSDFVGHPLKGEGSAELSGYVELATLDSLAYDLHLQAENLPLNYDDIFVAPGIDIQDASLSSTSTGSLLRCQVRIDHAQAEVPLFDLNAPPVPPPPATVSDPFLENMQLDIAVDLRDLQVENEVAQLRVEGIPRISGTFYKPQFQGSLEIPEGKAFVLNSEFAFEKGRISLDHPVLPYSLLEMAYEPLLLNPDLDIEVGTTVHLSSNDAAELGAEDCKVTLKMQGPTQGVVPVFTSEPSIPPLQIYYLLAFGTTQMPQDRAEYEKTLYTAASQLLLSRQVKRIGLDQFQILPSGTLLETVGEPSVRLGKFFKFPLPLQVNYEAATANPSEGEFRIEHKVGTYMTLTGAAQSKYQRYGLGIGLKKDF